MTKDTIKTVQAYVTIESTKILDIETLSKRHSASKILSLLESIMKDKKQTIKELISLNILTGELDKAIIEWFRLTLAVNLLREEVNYEASKAEQGAKSRRRSA